MVALTIIVAFGSAIVGALLGAYLQRLWTPDPRPEITAVGKDLGDQMKAMDPRPRIGALSTQLTDFQKRIEAIEQERTEIENFTLELSLQQAQQANYIMEAKNDSDRDVKAESIVIEYRGIPLCRPCKPKKEENWTIRKHSGVQIPFAPQPDPVNQLIYNSITPATGVAVPITLVVLCRIDGRLKAVRGIQSVTVDTTNKSMTPFGP